MSLPPKRKSARRDGPKIRFQGHRDWVRKHRCVLWQTGECDGNIECAHVRLGTDGGMGKKPADWWCISLCAAHHREQHQMGEPKFELTYAIDMKGLAQEFAQKSPKAREMRQAREEWAELTEGVRR